MRVKRLSDDDITEYCEGVNKLLASINERASRKKGKKQFEEVEEEYVVPDEDMFVTS